MLRLTVELLPGGSSVMREVIGQVVAVNLSPAQDPARYIVGVLDQWLHVTEVHEVPTHTRADGWTRLLHRGLSPDTTTTDPQALSVVHHAVDRLLDDAERRARSPNPEC